MPRHATHLLCLPLRDKMAHGDSDSDVFCNQSGIVIITRVSAAVPKKVLLVTVKFSHTKKYTIELKENIYLSRPSFK